MDDLITIGVIVLVFVLVIMPLLIIVLFYRLNRTRDAVQRLQQQVAQLTQGVAQAGPESARQPVVLPDIFNVPRASTASVPAPAARAAPTSAADLQPAPAAPPPTDARTGSTADPWQTLPGNAPQITVWQRIRQHYAPGHSPAASTGTASGKVPAAPAPALFAGLVSWFMRGNPLAKLGVLLLFFGLAYLLRYSIEQNYLSIQLRLIGAAVISLLMLALGWRLRLRQRLYALIIQGGAIGAFYITVFGAFKLYHQLPYQLAFALMLVICVASVALAVLQSSLSLAMLASGGGYLAPVLLSTGGGSHIALFSYYLLISLGILAVSRWQSWRALNLLGFVFTFGVAGLWGADHYQQDFYLSCQLFLIANLVLFGVLSVLFGIRNPLRGQWAVDGTLLFGPPLVGFGFQYYLTAHWQYGPAFSALGYGLFYLLAARTLFRRWAGTGRMMSLAGLALGGAFATLAIPLALSAEWTAIAWTVEGLGILWLGVSQQQQRLCWSGSAVMVLAAGAALRAWSDGMTEVSFITVFSLLALTGVVAGWLWQRRQPINQLSRGVSIGFLVAGLYFWLWTLSDLGQRLASDSSVAAMLLLASATLSAWIWLLAGRRLRWPALGQAAWLLWPVALWALTCQLTSTAHPLSAGAWALAWPLAVISAVLLLRRFEANAHPLLRLWGLHVAGFWLLLLLINSELLWRAGRLPWGNHEWQYALAMLGMSLPVLLVAWLNRQGHWPLAAHRQLYWRYALLPVIPPLVALLIAGNLMDGEMSGWRYLPLVNPLEESALLGLLASGIWLRHAWPRSARWFAIRSGYSLLVFWWLNGGVLRALAWAGDLPWTTEALWSSRLVQTSFAILWTFTALITMLYARRSGSRRLWFCGIGLLIVTVIKLFMVDGATAGGLGRAIAFLGVAVLMLIIGYFVPLPPRHVTGKEPHNDSQA